MGLRFSYPHDFEKIWRVYPNPANKFTAFKAFDKLDLDDAEVEELFQHISVRAKKDVKWLGDPKTGRKYIPHLSTFLNGRRWEDFYESLTPARALNRSSGPVTEDPEESKRKWALAEQAAGRPVPASYQQYLEVSSPPVDNFSEYGSWE